MKIHVSDLIFEVTRKCNMRCAHCLRGHAQNIDISNEIIDTTLEQLNSVASILFTGGEPSLNVDAIEYTLKVLKQRSMGIAGFYVITNGLMYSPKFILALIEYAAYCWDDEISGLAISRDQFHEEIPLENLRRYKALSFYRDSHEGEISETSIVNDGLALENNLGQNTIIQVPLSFEEYDNNKLVVEKIYINAKGDVLSCCDYSYSKQEQYKFGNVLERPLKEILLEQYQLSKNTA